MTHDDAHHFYLSLSLLEQKYWHRLHELFMLVQPQKPEKGIKTLLLRARALSEGQGIPLADALQAIYTGAEKRTHQRLALLQQCKLKQP